MHFEILVEDASGKIALGHFLDKILGPDGEPHTRKIVAYKGIGVLPKNLDKETDPKKKILLDKLPSLLRGYGRSFQQYDAVVMVVCDLDRRDYDVFTAELNAAVTACTPRPITLVRLAVEEGEAWLLGDQAAVLTAYPTANAAVLENYQQDSICGTWETLADAVHVGRAADLKKKVIRRPEGRNASGRTKSPRLSISKPTFPQVFSDFVKA
jgi:hypothetical protein